MKNIKIYRNLAFALILSLCLSCTAGFEQINNPKQKVSLEEMSRDNYLTANFMKQILNVTFPEQENAYQMFYDLLGNYLGRYFTYTKPGWNNTNYAVFNAPDSWINAPFTSRSASLESAYKEIVATSDKEDLVRQWANILRVATYIDLSDIYGAFPAGLDPKNPNAYNSQKDIYHYAFKTLTHASAVLSGILAANPSQKFFSSVDAVYHGDFNKWRIFCNSLVLRLALRISKVEPDNARKYAEWAVSQGVMLSNEDNCEIVYLPNGLYKTSVEWGDSRLCADLDSYMNGYNDPRLDKYVSVPAYTSGSPRKYMGCMAGAKIESNTNAKLLYSAAKMEVNSKGCFMNAAEMYFCRAEAALKGWNVGGTAKDLYNKGIEVSFQQWGASGAKDYIENSTDTPADYSDNSYGYGQNMPKSSSITIKWDDSASAQTKLERIMVQKWIAMYPLGQQAWCDIRRTGYPKVFPIVTTTNGYNQNVPDRVPYPQVQKVSNAQNYNYAVANLLNGPDTYNTKMWWQ